MKIFTNSQIQNALRVMVIVWLAFVAISSIYALYAMFPLEPTSIFLGADLGEPSYFAALITKLAGLALNTLVFAFLPLFFWAFLEDKFWPQPETSID